MAPHKVLLRSALVCLVIGLVFFGIALQKIEHLPLDGSPLEFNAKRAHADMWTLAKKFPHRLPWHENKEKSAQWLKKQLRTMGYQPQEMVFSSTIAGKTYTNHKNIYAEKKGSSKPDEIIVMLGHYDITDTTKEGAMDDASGVAVVLELARIFSKMKTERTLIFLMTDSEEFGAFWGARTFARSFDRADQIIAAASFDFVAPLEQEGIVVLCDGLRTGFTPLWLREMALNSIRAIDGVEARDMAHAVEFALRAILIPPADHGAFLAAGIPSFNWVGQNKDFAHQMAHFHHTEHDRAEVMKVESFRTYGQAAEKLIRSLDALKRLPEDYKSSSYWKMSQRHYLSGWAVTVLFSLMFIPFLLYASARFKSLFKKSMGKKVKEVISNEFKHVGIIFSSLLIGYMVIRVLPTLGIITQYEAFPATQKSVLLHNPNYGAIALVIGVIFAVYFAFSRVFKEIDDSEEYLDVRHAIHASLLGLIFIFAFVKNMYLATLILLPPAYLWTALVNQKKRTAKNRAFNMMLLLGGAITLVICLFVMGSVFHVGVIYWYMFLSAAYGLFSVYAMVVTMFVLTIMIRLFKKFVLN